MPVTAWSEGHRVLYHWQRFNATWLERSLAYRQIHCSSPNDFNDPWDCKPQYNTDLSDPVEHEKHVQWGIALVRRDGSMSEADIATMEATLRKDKQRAAALITEVSQSVASAIAADYRVYCLGPDVNNLLMWAHYADSHRGICLEYSLDNNIMSSAYRCEYLVDHPVINIHSNTVEDAFQVLLSKANAWRYENEYRLVAREKNQAMGAGTLMTESNMLQLPEGALTAVIVGCQGDFNLVNSLVSRVAPHIAVKRAVRVPRKYQIRIDG